MNDNTTFALQLVNMNDGSVTGHKAGCSDLKKLAKRHDVHAVEHQATKYAAWLDYNYDFIAEGGEENAWDIDWKACANHIPAGGPEVEAETDAEADNKPLTRKQCIARLAELGYTGPTSYLMPKVRQIVADIEAAAA